MRYCSKIDIDVNWLWAILNEDYLEFLISKSLGFPYDYPMGHKLWKRVLTVNKTRPESVNYGHYGKVYNLLYQ
jgi:hypothetical protein